MPVSTAPAPHTPVPTERTTVKGHDSIHTKAITPAPMAGNNGNSNAVTNHKLLINSTGAQELRQAASAGNVALVKELCKKSVPFDADIEGRTALHYASANGHSLVVNQLIESGFAVNAKDALGYTALLHAATDGHVDVVQLLLKNKANVDAQDDVHYNSALHEASWKGYSQTIEILCKNKANPYLKNKQGHSALHLACQQGHNQSCRILLINGCKPDIRNNMLFCDEGEVVMP
ncbi:unnamed protein product [Oppiella nova]|uniref:Uncharacterized protein n=1 Tax=Oppiella nova TaxID=334625 RepID=A0A7R9LUF4_9ACAR|nr:unnamed protein product [Oppiella nova]CAG2167072.1 unnamed protein product [Oppiella nova]